MVAVLMTISGHLAACIQKNPDFAAADGSPEVLPGDAAPEVGYASDGTIHDPAADVQESSPPGRIPTESLLGHWRMDEAAGAALTRDASGRGHDGLLEGLDPATAWSRSGRAGTALEFPANVPATAGVRVELTPELRAIQRFTLAAWTYRSTLVPQYVSVLSRQLGDGHNEVFNLAFNNEQLSVFTSVTGQPGGISLRARVFNAANRWVHVAATYDGQHLRLYADGKELASLAHSSPLPDSAQPLYIGTNKNGQAMAPQPWIGLLDEVMVFSDALAPDQLGTLATLEAPP
jgi:hypothetical protein